MFPHWIDKETFMKKTSYPIFNKAVFEAIKNYWN
jgi:hypothetical protein